MCARGTRSLRTPSAADVVRGGEHHEDAEEKQTAADDESYHLRRILHVHKEENYESRLSHCYHESNDGVPNVKIHERHSCSGACQDE